MSDNESDDQRLLRPSFEQIDKLFSSDVLDRQERIIDACESAKSDIKAQADAEYEHLRRALDDVTTFQRFALRSGDDREGIKQRLQIVRESLAALTKSVGGAWDDRSEPLHQSYAKIAAVFRTYVENHDKNTTS